MGWRRLFHQRISNPIGRVKFRAELLDGAEQLKVRGAVQIGTQPCVPRGQGVPLTPEQRHPRPMHGGGRRQAIRITECGSGDVAIPKA